MANWGGSFIIRLLFSITSLDQLEQAGADLPQNIPAEDNQSYDVVGANEKMQLQRNEAYTIPQNIPAQDNQSYGFVDEDKKMQLQRNEAYTIPQNIPAQSYGVVDDCETTEEEHYYEKV